MKGKLTKYRDNWAVEFRTEQQGENSWFTRLELEPSINSDKYKDLKMVEILNVPVVELEGKEVEFEVVTEYAKPLHFDMFQYARLNVMAVKFSKLKKRIMLKKKKQRLKTIENKLEKIESDFPNVNFKDLSLRNAINAHYELVKEMIGLKVDIKFCPTENRNER